MQRFSVLDAFRGLCALIIVFFHMKEYNSITNNAFINHGYLFVDFFFVLSGFVIAFVYYEKLNNGNALPRFFKNRFRRIYPLHIYTLLVFAAVELSRGYLYQHGYLDKTISPNNNGWTFLSNILLLNSTPLIGNGFSWNYPSWSISAEFITYLFWGGVMFLLRKSRHLKLIAGITIPLALILVSYAYTTVVFDAVLGFFTGVLTHKLFARFQLLNKLSRTAGSLLETAAIALTVVMVCYRPLFNNCPYIYFFLFALDIYIFAFEKGFISSLLKKGPFQLLGKYSYSIYLNHAVVIEVMNFTFSRMFSHGSLLFYLIPFLIAAVTVAYSSLTYKYIEMRFYKRHIHR